MLVHTFNGYHIEVTVFTLEFLANTFCVVLHCYFAFISKFTVVTFDYVSQLHIAVVETVNTGSVSFGKEK